MLYLILSYFQQHGNASKGFLLFLQSSRKLEMSGNPRTRFAMFYEQNISTTCKIIRGKARAAIALTYTYKYLLVDKLYILLFDVYVYVHFFCYLFLIFNANLFT